LSNLGFDPFRLFGVSPSIKTRLIISFSLAILIPSLLTALVGTYMIKKHVYKEAQSKVNSDLEYAKEIYGSNTTRIKDSLRIHATRKILYGALSGGDTSELGSELERIWLEEKLDFLTLIDTEGNVFYSTSRRGKIDHNYSDNDFVRYVIYHRQPLAGSSLIPLEELEFESPALKEQAFMEITPTPKARPNEEKFLKDGLVMAGAAPVFTPQKRFVGVLYGGVLLNRNYDIVDKIRSTIFEGGSLYKGKPTGTVTIFQGDVRISTNVLSTDGSRAISTKVSSEVADAVLSGNETFSGKAFVVNDWYLSSYTPIKNTLNKTIGILYVGILEKPYIDSLLKSLQVFLSLVFFGVLFVGFLSLRVAGRISTPISKLAEAAKKVGEGDYDMKVDVGERNDEIGRFAEDFNKMVNEVRESHLAMTTWTEVLEEKVEERTRALKSIQDQLVQTEKLAGIGRLAAGVAHEINNPLTGILTNSSLMLEDLPEEDPRRDDLKVIVDETLRCRKIVKGLLDFARQSPPQKQLVSLNGVIEDVITLVRNQANFRNIRIDLKLDQSVPQIFADRDQIRQVVLNIVLNAADAMPGGGEFNIRSSSYAEDGFIELSFRDTGEGIPADVKEKLFEPFVTTKKSGTGLGLSIAYGIIERHKGKIAVESAAGKGTTFRIILPVRQDEG
jgi:two-component system, NtrC family, sensor kinase